MVIAVGYDDGAIYSRLADCGLFALYYTDEEGNDIVMKKLAEYDPLSGGTHAEFLEELGVSAVVCTEISDGERTDLASRGIVGFSGFEGFADVAADVLMGNVPYGAGGCGGGSCGGCCGEDGECGGGCGGHDGDGDCGCGCHGAEE